MLQAEQISGRVQLQNVPGAGGTMGLAQVVARHAGRSGQRIVVGSVTVGAILTGNSPVSLTDVIPIARLSGEYEAIVVPAFSPITDIGQLVEQLRADPGSVCRAGGSTGGADRITVGLLAKAAGVEPTKPTISPALAAARRWRRSLVPR